MKKLQIIWYLSETENLYKIYYRFRLADTQIAKYMSEEFKGDWRMHLANVRRSRCNDSNQPYVDAKFENGVWVKNK